MKYLLKNGLLLLPDGMVEEKMLYIDGAIVAIAQSVEPQEDVRVIDLEGRYVAPGFVDIHIHGCGGADVMDATPQALHTISDTLLQTGTTTFLATTMTMSIEAITAALENIRSEASHLQGAQVAGVHMEGPFINPKRAGAQDRSHVITFNRDLVEKYAKIIRLITLAPELEGAEAFIRWIEREHPHMVLSIGHTDATYDQSMEAFGWGVSHVTHLFNAMPPYHHREPGVVGAAFDAKGVTCDIIADTIHTHPHHLRLAYQMKKEALLLITDAMRAGCMHEGYYTLGGQRVEVKENRATLEDGTLAGSLLTMNEAVKVMVKESTMSLHEAICAASTYPAKRIGLQNKGALIEGYDADIVVLDANLDVWMTIVQGEIKYQRSS